MATKQVLALGFTCINTTANGIVARCAERELTEEGELTDRPIQPDGLLLPLALKAAFMQPQVTHTSRPQATVPSKGITNLTSKQGVLALGFTCMNHAA